MVRIIRYSRVFGEKREYGFLVQGPLIPGKQKIRKEEAPPDFVSAERMKEK